MSLIAQLRSLSLQPVESTNGLILPFRTRLPQSLRRVPFTDPCLMLILQGEKQLHPAAHPPQQLPAGRMLLIPAGCELTFTNQPDEHCQYLAWVISLPADDLLPLARGPVSRELQNFHSDPLLLTLMQQWLQLQPQLSDPQQLLQARRREITQRLIELGYSAELRSGLQQQLSRRVQTVVSEDLSHDWQIAEVCQHLAVSESTLRRKLSDEQRSFRDLLSQLRLTQGLNLLQTTSLSVQQVADACGYRSASRFSERFRERFGTSPGELRQSQDPETLIRQTTVSGLTLTV
jgi:AraC-like DNA-binding protein